MHPESQCNKKERERKKSISDTQILEAALNVVRLHSLKRFAVIHNKIVVEKLREECMPGVWETQQLCTTD